MKNEAQAKLTLTSKIGVYAALILLSLPAILPLLWMVSTSFKGNAQIFGTSEFNLKSLIPSPVVTTNYPEALTNMPFVLYLRNTMLLCICTVVGAVASSAVVAYGFAKIYFPGRNALFAVMIATMALPGQVTMIPVFSLFRSLGWYGTYLPLIVPAFTASAYYVFLLTQFFKTIPTEMSEAARVDGANEWTIFRRLLLPLSKPALATCALFQFIGTWNDFLGPLLYVNDPAKYPLAYGLQQFVSHYGGFYAQLMAAATIFTIPIIILFFFAQKTFIQGISTTGGK
ncbi:carbohydrate ABC transporter permease [Fimbriimonas ginsengisoli]|uniref:Sugar ABC transporter permease n=1 Tax=Fimbriimonas ginsengisoli Gsoil 348 TaxID=661478 RepID=A0A068NT02_FIMGI|nr:carbohydrate ABC transporter permease [Fimbriimonas ginsengisoli]AIE86477.1 sugar ABC transporter permease [Fimbriimonas ginsengisoli Gsoil 348]